MCTFKLDEQLLGKAPQIALQLPFEQQPNLDPSSPELLSVFLQNNNEIRIRNG